MNRNLDLTQEEAQMIALRIMNHPDVESTTDEDVTGHYGLIDYSVEVDTSFFLPVTLPAGKCIASFISDEHDELRHLTPDNIDFDFYNE